LYFDRFGRMLWVGTRDNIVSYLRALPDTPTAPGQYDTTFAALKAYIITNDHPEYSTQEFLSPVLVRHWHGQRQLEPELGALATAQFDFFASELPFGNPYDPEDRADLVSRSRRFLAQFGDTDRLYQALINEASNNAPAVQFHRDVPGSDRVLRNPVVVPGAFTEPGWEFVQTNLDNVDQFLAGDEWVLGGELSVSPAERIRLANDLRRRYIEDYIRLWTQYLAETSVLSYSGARDAANKLETLGSNTSPMLQLFAIAARHTNVDSVNVAPAFQPVHAVVPPGTTSYVGPTNEQYVAGLSDLSRAMEQAGTGASSEQASAVEQAKGTADRLEGVVAQMTRSFAPQGPAAQVGNAVSQLLSEPVTRLQPLIVGIPNAAVNARGASFCADATPVLSKYPFRQGATDDATIEDLNQLFMPGGSALSTLVEGLQDLIIKQGNEYRARPGVQRPPSSAFLGMLNRMQRISDALYGINPQEPTVRFLLRPQPTELATEIIVNVDGRPHRTTRQEYTAGSFEWRLSGARAASIVARNSQGRTLDELSETGSWSLFRLLGRASWATSAGNTYRLTWNVPTAGTIAADLTMRGAPVFNPRELERLSCVRTVVGP
jgi:type VI secretion system protein ImpL